jgi:hypothetical protein
MINPSSCNYCIYQHLKQRDKEKGSTVITRPGADCNLPQGPGVDLFVVPKLLTDSPTFEEHHPPDQPIRTRSFKKAFWVMWLYQLPEHCVCD